MTDVAHMYDKAPFHLVKGDWTWKSGVTTLYMALYTTGYTPAQSTDETYSTSSELATAAGYTQGGAQMTPNDPVVTGSDPSAYTKLYSSDVTWATSTFTGVATVVIYNNTGSKYLIGFMTYGTPKASQGGNFIVKCPTNGWFDLATP